MSMPDLDLNVVDTPDKVADFLEWLKRPRNIIGADTETTGIDPHAPGFKVRLLQFGDASMSGWAIPFQGWHSLAEHSLRWLSDNGIRTTWHNLAFDAAALHTEGIRLDMSMQDDTFVWSSLCGFADESRALKSIASRNFGQWAMFGQKLLSTAMANAGWTWATVPIDFKPYVGYGTIDPIITAMYRESLGDQTKPFEWHHSLEIAVIELTNLMARNGLGVNTEYAIDQIDQLTTEEERILTELQPHGIDSAGQNVKIAKVLESAGVLPEIIKYTGTGQISVDKEFLATIDHPVARGVLAARAVQKTRSYLEAMVRFSGGNISPLQIIHPEIRSIEARTGRMSIASPALQQLPAVDEKDPESIRVRRAIIPRNPDEVLIGADFGQIELRMFGALSKDQKLLDVLNQMDAAKAAGDKGADFFVHLGQDLYHEPDFKKSDPRRTSLKSTTYATIYGAGIEKIAETAKTSASEIAKILGQLKGRYESFNDLGESAIVRTAEGWEVGTPTGRKFRVKSQTERRKLNNYRIQGTSAEVLKLALINVAEAGWAENLMLPVHDEIIMSVPRNKAQQAKNDLVEAMNAVIDPEQFGVAVQASAAEPAENWGDLSH